MTVLVKTRGDPSPPMTIGVHNQKPVWKPPRLSTRCFFIEGIFYKREISIEGIFYSGFPFSREWRSWWNQGRSVTPMTIGVHDKKVCLKNPLVSQKEVFFIGGISIEFFSIKSIEGIYYSGFPFSREWRSWWKPGAIRPPMTIGSPQQKSLFENPRLSTKVFFL